MKKSCWLFFIHSAPSLLLRLCSICVMKKSCWLSFIHSASFPGLFEWPRTRVLHVLSCLSVDGIPYDGVPKDETVTVTLQWRWHSASSPPVVSSWLLSSSSSTLCFVRESEWYCISVCFVCVCMYACVCVWYCCMKLHFIACSGGLVIFSLLVQPISWPINRSC